MDGCSLSMWQSMEFVFLGLNWLLLLLLRDWARIPCGIQQACAAGAYAGMLMSTSLLWINDHMVPMVMLQTALWWQSCCCY
jgi:hypothetical protein